MSRRRGYALPRNAPAVSAFFCQHPTGQRRRYGDLRVCRECLSVKVGDSAWQPTRRMLRGTGTGRIELLTETGELLARDWRYVATRG
jgi:hypothetical protein